MNYIFALSACLFYCVVGAPTNCFAGELWQGPNGSSILLNPGWRSMPIEAKGGGAYFVYFQDRLRNSCVLIRTQPPSTASQSQQRLNEISEPNQAISNWRELLAPLQKIMTNLSISPRNLNSKMVGGVRQSLISTSFPNAAGATIFLDGVFVKRPTSFEYFFCYGSSSDFYGMVDSYSMSR